VGSPSVSLRDYVANKLYSSEQVLDSLNCTHDVFVLALVWICFSDSLDSVRFCFVTDRLPRFADFSTIRISTSRRPCAHGYFAPK
jgi:hypothetical protein